MSTLVQMVHNLVEFRDHLTWLVALELCGVPAFEWRPTDWEEIERVLTMGPQTVTA